MYLRFSLLSLVAEATLEGVQLLQRAASHADLSKSPHAREVAVIDKCTPSLDWHSLMKKCGEYESFDFNRASSKINNLGGFGPMSGVAPVIHLHDIRPGQKSAWELEVSVTDTPGNHYQPNIYHGSKDGFTKNGKHGHFLQINLLTGTTTNFTFKFMNMRSEPFTLSESMYLSIFDFDEGRANASREFAIFDPPCAAVYTFEADQELRATCTDANTTLISTHTGGKVGNPEHPLGLSTLQRKRTATCLLASGIDGFTVTLGEINYAHEQGRNIFFGGPSNLVCPAKQSCADYACPDGYSKKKNDEFLYCNHQTCLESGEGKTLCCNLE